MHLKNNKRKNYKIIKKLILLSIVFFLLFITYIISKNLTYYYENYSIKKARDIVDISLNTSIKEKSLELIKNKDIFKITKNTSGEIEMIDYDTYLVNIFLEKVSNDITSALKTNEIDKNKATFYIPLGSITNIPFFASKGPKLPVRMEMIGKVYTNIKTKMKSYGINNTMIEIYVDVKVREKIILPMVKKEIEVKDTIPISYKIITGKIPTYYGNTFTKESSIFSYPIE